jgi:hypothetical protein
MDLPQQWLESQGWRTVLPELQRREPWTVSCRFMTSSLRRVTLDLEPTHGSPARLALVGVRRFSVPVQAGGVRFRWATDVELDAVAAEMPPDYEDLPREILRDWTLMLEWDRGRGFLVVSQALLVDKRATSVTDSELPGHRLFSGAPTLVRLLDMIHAERERVRRSPS